MLKKFFKTIFYYDWEVIEVQASLIKIAWGIWLLLPFQTFGSSGYAGIASVMTENDWGVCIFIIGVVHLLGIMSHNVWFRRNMILFGVGFWSFMAVVFYFSRPGNIAIPFMIVQVFFLLINFLRLSMPKIFIRHES